MIGNKDFLVQPDVLLCLICQPVFLTSEIREFFFPFLPRASLLTSGSFLSESYDQFKLNIHNLFPVLIDTKNVTKNIWKVMNDIALGQGMLCSLILSFSLLKFVLEPFLLFYNLTGFFAFQRCWITILAYMIFVLVEVPMF